LSSEKSGENKVDNEQYHFTPKGFTVKTFQLTLTAMLLGLATVACTQDDPPPNDFMRTWQSPMMQHSMKMSSTANLRAFWNGQGTSMMAAGLLNDPDIRIAWDISDEQYQQIRSTQKSPEMQEAMLEYQTLQNPNDPLMENTDEETKKKLFDIQERMILLNMDDIVNALDNALTSEQKQKIGEAQLASMGEIPFISLSAFEALNLTDVQKRQMERIKKELEPEFEKHLNNFSDGNVIMTNKILDAFGKQGGKNFEDLTKKAPQIVTRLKADDPQFKKTLDDIMSQSRLFTAQFKTAMFDVLTDEQWKRLQELIDTPPEHAKVLRKKLKEQMGESEKTAWAPGPNSWRPGDPIPEGYRQQRQERGRFPRVEQSE
jgi:Ni/Co efflux regulator RcnB